MNLVYKNPFTVSPARLATLLSFLILIIMLCWLSAAEAAPRGSHRFVRPGERVRNLPSGHVTVRVGRDSYRYNRGIFYRPDRHGYVVVRAPIGARIRYLPPGFISFTIGLNRYFYINSTYYLWEPVTREYVVVNAPAGAQAAVTQEGDGAVGEMFVYPAHGQTNEQTSQDRYECYVWASEQSGFDPSAVNQNPDGRSGYNRAFTACLEGRGYTVR